MYSRVSVCDDIFLNTPLGCKSDICSFFVSLCVCIVRRAFSHVCVCVCGVGWCGEFARTCTVLGGVFLPPDSCFALCLKSFLIKSCVELKKKKRNVIGDRGEDTE